MSGGGEGDRAVVISGRGGKVRGEGRGNKWESGGAAGERGGVGRCEAGERGVEGRGKVRGGGKGSKGERGGEAG